jgi:dsRNA-specific ribonuclease
MRKDPDIEKIETRMPPPLPVVQSDTALAIFVHASLKSSVQSDRFGDAERLAFLGQKVLHMVIAETLFEKRPMMTAVDLIVSAPCTVHIVLLCILLLHRPN